MAAIIRRHRFTIIVIICSLILMMLSWHFHRKQRSVLNSTPVSYAYANSNHEIQMPESDIQYSSDITKISNNIEGKQPQFINIRKFPEYEKNFPFVPTKTAKESTKYQVEEHFIPTQPETNEFTTKLMMQHEEKFVNGDEDLPVLQHLERKFSSPSKVDMAADTKYSELKESPFTVPHFEKPVSLLAIHQPKEGFIAPDQDNEWAKTEHVTFSASGNKTDTMGMWSINKHIMLNQKESSSVESNIASSGKNSVLLIDTPGCKIPRLDPWDPTIRDLIELQDPYVCPGLPVFLKSHPGDSMKKNGVSERIPSHLVM
ncbi:hypothetical protein AVEN_144619-1 [Araneus ventricosus]|uniref:Uncharacterized protein n=1 Tax=Araneus ventricosus TaxID=182803 RepID=A0A4Y2BZ55_ARAVE|nr:hypothetical protein AVEN_144619-1 [Araneus ventricosus]